MYFADLHVHTTVSDCSEDVSVILNMAKETGITHIAFTDHDTTKMAPEHISRAEAMGISAISGVEMSACDYDSGIRAHILGYGYVTTSHIEKIGAETLRKRNENCLRQMEILRQLGYTIEEEKIREMASGCIYKQHILAYLRRRDKLTPYSAMCIRKFLKTEARVILISNIRGLRSVCRPYAATAEPRFWLIPDSRIITISFPVLWSLG